MADDPPVAAAPARRRRSRRWLLAVSGLVLLCAGILLGILPRRSARDRTRSVTAELAVPYVSVTRPERAAPMQQLVLPGSVEAYTTAPIFARASGYVRKWYFDIGAQVKKGQLLAEIEVPEIEQQLAQARATLAASEANLRLAEATARRFTDLRQTRAVSQLEVDNALGSYKANRGTFEANKANVRQLEKVLGYAQVRAPFDGLITMRNVDVGDLINAGSTTTPNTALFQIAQPDKLRVYVAVPEPYAPGVKPGMAARLILPAFPGRQFTGNLVRTASAIDPTTRTLLVEIEVDNTSKLLYSGGYAEVRLDVPTARDVFILPVETLLFRKEGLHVAIVERGRVVLKPIVPEHDFGDRIEVGHGLNGDEVVIVSPPDSIADGEQVRIATPARPTASTR